MFSSNIAEDVSCISIDNKYMGGGLPIDKEISSTQCPSTIQGDQVASSARKVSKNRKGIRNKGYRTPTNCYDCTLPKDERLLLEKLTDLDYYSILTFPGFEEMKETLIELAGKGKTARRLRQLEQIVEEGSKIQSA